MLTAKGKYSLKALGHLATLEPGATAQAIDIAATNNIPKKFLDAILGELRNAGIVYSRKGPGGGYMLARAPSQIKIGHVIRTVDGPLAPFEDAESLRRRVQTDEKHRPLFRLLLEVRDATARILDHTSVADLCKQ